MNNKYYLTIDIGASSGRHIIGWLEDKEIRTEEVYRFHNQMDNYEGHMVWNIDRLFNEVVNGIKKAFSKYSTIESLAIDTWGVDYVLMQGDKPVLPVYAYRDNRTKEAINIVHNIVPFDDLYRRTGIHFQPFNTIYQLYADKLNGRLEGVTNFLMIPEYLNFLLTGKMVKEYTNATTTGLINVKNKTFDTYIVDKLGLNEKIFVNLELAGAMVGYLTSEVTEIVNGQSKVILCNSHDTASAVFGIKMSENSPYISSGTWSLLGIKQDISHTDEQSKKDNFSNEGYSNRTFRYQKNIMGMWIVNQIVKEMGINITEFISYAKKSHYDYKVDINHADFIAPHNMTETIKKHLDLSNVPPPETMADLASCVLHSLAQSYKDALFQLECNVGTNYNILYIVGGGAKNMYLNDLTAKYTRKKVIALPIEATAIGNLKIQMETDR